MRNATFIALFLAVMLLLAGGTAYSQTPRRRAFPFPSAPAAPAASSPAAPAAAQKPAPEPPKPASSVTIEDGRLSVALVDADLGKVMNEIGAKMHFTVVISGGVYGKKISTTFTRLDVERGIERLLSLAQENNYLIHYDTAGNLTRIELYSPTAPSLTMQRPIIRNPMLPPPRRYRRYVPPPPLQGQPTPGQ